MTRRKGKSVTSLDHAEADVPLWKEFLWSAEFMLLHASPTYYGIGVPRGDGSGVIVIPGFLGGDAYLVHMLTWLARIGYRPFLSGILFNVGCPNLLIREHLESAIAKARRETRRKVHLIGHSLGGIIARSIAAQRPQDIASVVTIASPFRGTVMHRTVMQLSEMVRHRILARRGSTVLPECYTMQCTCNFLNSVRRGVPAGVMETAIYTRSDGVVDWRYCVTGSAEKDFEVTGTHIGLAFNSSVYKIISDRLRASRAAE
jgi:triacylglycerol lipase